MRRALKGSLKLEPISLREWLPKLGIDAPKTTDPNVLKQLSFAGNVKLTKSSAEVGDIVLKLDDTTCAACSASPTSHPRRCAST